MFTQCKWILIYDTIILFLYSDIICAKNTMKFAGIVENITVYALESGNYLESDNILTSLKLNVSWMPPKGERQPSSYSITIMSIPEENDINRIECPEGFAFYPVQNKSQFNLLVPQFLHGMSEIQIRLNCTYKIQVHANPRANPLGRRIPEIIYTVPECVGRKCSCVNARASLPVPKVEAIHTERNIVINWNITSNNSFVYSYVISIGTPLLTSKAGHSVYNITKISNVTSATNTFIWDSKINNQYIKVKNGYKILVAATDYQGCLGTQGNFTIVITDETDTSHGIMWLLFIGIIVCIILGFVSISILNKNEYQLLWLPKFLRKRQAMPAFSIRKTQWPDSIFEERNIMYIAQKPEETCCKINETENDEFEIPYKCINVTCELGKGQFGRVFLGNLNNNTDTLVAVKMSQCTNASDEPEARHQLLEEIKTMKVAGFHPNLVSLIGYCTSPDNPICILLEYIEGGDLLEYLHSRRKIESDEGTIEKQQFMNFALDIARGMEHLETKGIVHRDLAARNILLTSDLKLKVSDFGLSRNGIYVINNVAGKVRQLPIRWMSPEAVRDHIFSSKSDVWSFGVVLWEIGTLGSFPYPDIQDDELLRYLTQDKCCLTCPDTISHDVYKIMCSCWNTAPHDRSSFAQLVLDLQILKEPLHSMHEASNPCYTLLT